MPVEIVFILPDPFQNKLYPKAFSNYSLDKWKPKFWNSDIIIIKKIRES